MAKKGTARRHSGAVFLIIILLFAIPLGLAVLLYAKKETVGEGLTNHGHLIQPPFSVNELKFYGHAMTHGKWLLLYLHTGPCGEQCRHDLYNLKQIRVATGKNRNRVARGFITYQTNPNAHHIKALLTKNYKGTRYFSVDPQQFQTLFHKKIRTDYATAQGAFYLVDPLGNVMMVYKPNSNPDGIYKDIKRLLKISQIG